MSFLPAICLGAFVGGVYAQTGGAVGTPREENGTGAAVRVSLPDAVAGALSRSPRLESLRKRGLQARESG
ncbi:MAG: hypothetical protein AAB578_07180, partial [Elusimicrobiota bacterium]